LLDRITEQQLLDGSSQPLLQTPSKGAISNRKLSQKFIQSNQSSAKQKNNNKQGVAAVGPYTLSPNTTIEQFRNS